MNRTILKAFALAACLFPAALAAQSVITVEPRQCVWHAGDDLGWSAPQLDEAGWKPYAKSLPDSSESRIWIRCHADLSLVSRSDQPALQITVYAAYQVFADGRLIGSAGNLQSGAFSMNAVRTWTLPGNPADIGIIALRVTRRIASMVPVAPLPPMEIHAGSVDLLNGRRSSLILAQGKQHLLPAICFSIIAVFGIVALGLYLNDRSRRELLQIGICCLLLAPIYLDYLGAAAFLSYSSAAYFFSWAAPALVTNLTRTFFFFALARRRVPLAFWMLIAVAIVFYLATLALAFLAPGQALWLDGMRTRQIAEFSELAAVIESFAPFVAFSPWKGVSRRMKPLAVLCMAWGITMAAFFALRVTGAHIPGVPDLQARWGTPVSDVEAVVTLSVIAALLALLFREQQQTARDRTLLAGEMQAAGEIQRMLAPTTIDTAPGLKIDVAFHPMREVGGDFYLCRVLSDGRQRVLLGDVSGKGAAAAMAATLILGAAAARDSDSPAALLAHLNRVLCENHLSGFATCLCADLSPAGSVTLANAGHLSPYRRGQEIAIPAGLPLGLTPGLNSAYEQIAFELAPGDALTFLSDGVVEARNAAGTLFGFDRTQALSSQPASAIAQAAHAFGQNDDITVLTVTRLAPVSEPPPERVAPVLAPA